MSLKPPIDPTSTFQTLDSLDERLDHLPFNVKDTPFGALGDGSTDDTTAIQAALTAAGAVASGSGSNTWGAIYLPPGRYMVSTTLSPPTGVVILTDGAPNVILQRTANVPLITFSGQGPLATGGGGSTSAGVLRRLRIPHGITLDGGSNASWSTALFKSWYSQDISAPGMMLRNGYGDAFDLLMVWDSFFDEAQIDSCGKGDGTTYCVHVRTALQGTSAGQTGYSTDKANNIVFRDLRIENPRDAFIYVDGRTPAGTVTSAQRVQRVTFPGKLKMESSIGAFTRTPIRFEGTNACTIHDLELLIQGLAGGATAQNYIENVNSIASRIFGVVRMMGGGGNSVRAMVRTDTCESVEYGLLADAAADNFPSTAYYEWVNSSNHVKWSIGFPSGDRGATHHSGTVPFGVESQSAHNYQGASGDLALNAKIVGDSNQRVRVKVSSTPGFEFGDGTQTPTNTRLYMLSAGTSSTVPGELESNAKYRVTMDTTQKFNRILSYFQSGDTQPFYEQQLSGIQKWGPGGSTAPDTTWFRQAAAIIGTDNSDISVNLAGKGLRVKEGSNAKQGTSTLVAGTVTVSNTSVTASSRILLTVQSLGTVAAPKAIAVTARTAGTSFTITSADATDTSVIAWQIFEPA